MGYVKLKGLAAQGVARYGVPVLAGVGAVLAAGPSWATDPSPGDYSTAIGTAQTNFVSVISANLPAVLGMLVAVGGVSWVMRKVKGGLRGA